MHAQNKVQILTKSKGKQSYIQVKDSKLTVYIYNRAQKRTNADSEAREESKSKNNERER